MSDDQNNEVIPEGDAPAATPASTEPMWSVPGVDYPTYKQTEYEEAKEPFYATRQDRFMDLRTGQWGLWFTNIEEIILARNPVTMEGSVSFGTQIESIFLGSRDFAKVWPVPLPASDYYEVKPTQNPEDNRWYQTWTQYIPSEEELEQRYESTRAGAVEEVRTVVRDRQAAGIKVDFGGAYGVLSVQCRDTDRINMLFVKDEANALVAANKGDEILLLRTAENINVEIMADDFVKLFAAYWSAYKSILAWAWNYADQIRVKVRPEEMPEIPTSIDLETIVVASL